MDPRRRNAIRVASLVERIKMKIDSNDFRVKEGDEVNLKKWPAAVDPVYKSKEHYQELLRHANRRSSGDLGWGFHEFHQSRPAEHAIPSEITS